jgi:hypothetical protein
MTNPNQDVRAILREIVSDLEKTTAGMTYMLQELNKKVPMGGASLQDAIARTLPINKEFYDKLRAQIQALEISPQSKRRRLLR